MPRNSLPVLEVSDAPDVQTAAHVGNLRDRLRAATAVSHDQLDSALGSLDQTTKAGYTRFLMVNAIGWTALWPQWQRFSKVKLQRPCTPYLQMLRDDLFDLGIDPASLPLLHNRVRSSVGAGYVLSGSRMGMGVIRKSDYWGKTHGTARRFFSDDTGPELFRATLAWMAQDSSPPSYRRCIESSAVAAFDVFAQAFDRSADIAA